MTGVSRAPMQIYMNGIAKRQREETRIPARSTGEKPSESWAVTDAVDARRSSCTDAESFLPHARSNGDALRWSVVTKSAALEFVAIAAERTRSSTGALPQLAAQCRGVQPCPSIFKGSAPRCSNSATTWSLPATVAQCSAVRPSSSTSSGC